MTQAFSKAQNLPAHLQDELAQQLIEDIEGELKWQQSLSQPLKDSANGTTEEMGFDEL